MTNTPFLSAKAALVARFIPVLNELVDMTPGAEVERWLNATHGVDSPTYKDLARLLTLGVEEGWVADLAVTGPHYRRSRVIGPCAETFFFSATAVFMDSTATHPQDSEGSFRGDHHAHPYGEINLVVPLNEGAALAGPNGWCHGGWTVPAPGSQHFPEVKGGAVVSLTFLPAGRIAFGVQPLLG
jgi:hypothetical protein